MNVTAPLALTQTFLPWLRRAAPARIGPQLRLIALAHRDGGDAHEPHGFAWRIATTAESSLAADDLPASAVSPLGWQRRTALIDRAQDVQLPKIALRDKRRGWVR